MLGSGAVGVVEVCRGLAAVRAIANCRGSRSTSSRRPLPRDSQRDRPVGPVALRARVPGAPITDGLISFAR